MRRPLSLKVSAATRTTVEKLPPKTDGSEGACVAASSQILSWLISTPVDSRSRKRTIASDAFVKAGLLQKGFAWKRQYSPPLRRGSHTSLPRSLVRALVTVMEQRLPAFVVPLHLEFWCVTVCSAFLFDAAQVAVCLYVREVVGPQFAER